MICFFPLYTPETIICAETHTPPAHTCLGAGGHTCPSGIQQPLQCWRRKCVLLVLTAGKICSSSCTRFSLVLSSKLPSLASPPVTSTLPCSLHARRLSLLLSSLSSFWQLLTGTTHLSWKQRWTLEVLRHFA